MVRLGLLLLVLSGSAAAQDLEAGGLLWIEPVLPKGVRQAVIATAFPTLRFEGGMVEEGFVFGAPLVLPEGCEAAPECAAPGDREGVFRAGPYRIEGGTAIAMPIRTDRVFESAEREDVFLAATTFGRRAVPVRREGPVLVTGTGADERVWLGLPAEEVAAIRALIASGGFSLRALGACGIAAHHRRWWTPEDERGEDDAGFLAAARFALRIERLREEAGAASRAGERERARALAIERLALVDAIRALVADEGAALPMPEGLADRLEDGGAAIRARLREDEGFLRAAARGARLVEAAQYDPEAGRAAICG